MAFLCYRWASRLQPRTLPYILYLSRPMQSVFTRHINNSTVKFRGREEVKPLSYLQSGAVHHRMKEEERRRWNRRKWAYNYILLPCSTTAFFIVVYLIYFSKEPELTEEQIEKLKFILDRIEARKRLDVPEDSNKRSNS